MLIILGILCALSMMFMIFKIGLRRVVGYQVIADFIITGFLIVVFSGTYSGMVVGLIGGLTVSVILYILSKTIYAERLEMHKAHVRLAKSIDVPVPALRWTLIPPGGKH